MKKWEYLLEEINVGSVSAMKSAQSRLDDLGEQGWELCGTVAQEYWLGRVIFKRELED
ncbi:MAG: hypothetical protein UY31_C0045G0006 [Candidatus Wolfebacteria bacterium GW2011_GWE1_48_7]|uniref:DUF4177 domain-containing protein n=1 Tax=Candidatus Wolfebacteria bacterium GW2011_GWB1_47_1 TaxID=1619007 RepID=A0A0G4ATR7_9BACT|nr:MAG: hypothetical protein UX70_C0001G1000 [Candidatus Wolfebacteria bacterium GW2011_GWB1_47_1]KKU35254.1 MAG: hypothetical protein UX49_C0028G0006 [Candidatus Wolfebacteria bacterium GW2011_GWC2_46_275]KKU41166.1 MAG: hypothetical protein UX58_C0010G0010 [Candidatus Wolfebacteria bacterium GW2011_GWB2_46_69]KKU53409.1 MAG: hypothetical protein UX76_C0017G0006 [Candidatus Wolfebacteria bacterium GW2011_GWC1_47_103]KKU58795.1 MAG: hypothetical protein UX83_C0011G0007 [Candidatus Wolfebacteria